MSFQALQSLLSHSSDIGMQTFAEVVDVSHPFSRLSFAFHDNVLDFGVGRRYQQLRAEEADTAKNFDGFC